MTGKTDLKKAARDYFTAPKDDFGEAAFPAYRYLMIDGQGSPGESEEYAAAHAAHYPLA